MKLKELGVWVIAVLIISTLGVFGFLDKGGGEGVSIRISFPKHTYNLGEPVAPTFELTNFRSSDLTITDRFNVMSGAIRVSAVKDNGTVIGLGTPRWGIGDFAARTSIPAGKSIQTSAGILWWVNEQDKVAFRITEPGDYEFRVHFTIPEQGREPYEIVSQPVRIRFNEPTGADLNVWRSIRDVGAFAYFLQEGDLTAPGLKGEARDQFVNKIEQILADFPSSSYASYLESSLLKARAKDAKRVEAERRLKLARP